MHTKYKIFSILIIAQIGCKNTSIDTVRLPSKQPISVELNYQQEKNLVFSDSSKNRPISIKFIDAQDDRCDNNKCEVCYGGYATVRILVSSTLQKDTVSLTRISCISGDISIDSPSFAQKNVQGIGIGLSNMSDKSNSIKKYSVKLLIIER